VLVSAVMMQGLAIDMTDLINAPPIVLTLLVTALTNNLVTGWLGTLSYIRAGGHDGLLLQDSSDRLGAGGGVHWPCGHDRSYILRR
jgi:hypothetical protein